MGNGTATAQSGPTPTEGALRRQVQRSLRMQKLRALMLIMPLFLFISITFVAPIVDMLFRSVENPLVSNVLPRTSLILKDERIDDGWTPGEELLQALYFDLSIAVDGKNHTRLGSRLNYEKSGIASLFRRTGRSLDELGADGISDELKALDPAWVTTPVWFELLDTDQARGLLPYTSDIFVGWQDAMRLTGKDPHDRKIPDYLYAALLIEVGERPDSDWPAGIPHATMLDAVRDIAANRPGFDFTGTFRGINEAWLDIENWKTIRLYLPRYTEGYFLNSVDLKKGFDGPELRDETERIYIPILIRTMYMSMAITFLCFMLGYPVAFLLANLPVRHANLLLILVLLPFWTSLLVRTSAWKVLLQNQGVINDILVFIGIINDSGRLAMINNQAGTIIAMTHILLPFMILPLYSVMKTIPPSYVRAARSLGANAWTAFRKVYFPQSMPGIGAGSILVFILSIGYYITPELVGGTKGTFISNRIAYHISTSLNWGLGAALGTMLLLLVLALYWIYDRMVGIDNVRLG